MGIPQETIDRVLDVADIVEVIGEYVSLKRKGVNYIGVCPFHNEKHPSMSVSPSKGIYKCFSCGNAGNVITFLCNIDSISYPEAIRQLAKKYHIEIKEPEMNSEERAAMLNREAMRIVLDKANEIFQVNLTKNEVASNYLISRDIHPETAAYYMVGYAEPGKQLLKEMTNYNLEKMKLAGLVADSGNGPYDFFRSRIMFPFLNINGHVLGFNGRLLDANAKDQKYANSPETEIYHKGEILFGLFQAKREIIAKDEVFLVEGQMDVLSLFQRGVKNVVCTSGTALTEKQVKLLLRFTNNITLIFDGDDAGINATVKSLKLLLPLGARVRAISLPYKKDPDEFARSFAGEELARELLGMKRNIVSYLYLLRKPSFSDVYKKNEALKEACACVSLISDKSIRVSLGQDIAKLYEVEYPDIKNDLKSVEKPDATWKAGFYGIDEAKEMMDEEDTVLMTNNIDRFMNEHGERPIILAWGDPVKSNVQFLRTRFQEILIDNFPSFLMFDEKKEGKSLLLLKEMFREGISIDVSRDDQVSNFLDEYVKAYGDEMNSGNVTSGKVRGCYVDRCAEMIACASPSVRNAMRPTYIAALKLPASDYKAALEPFLAKKKDKAVLELQRLNDDQDLLEYDPEGVPSYVFEDENLNKIYQMDGFYPLLNKEKHPIAYMFKNDKGGGHTCISDFYMTPLLHVFSIDSAANKRVIQLNHRHFKKTQYVEWQSSVMANIGKVNEKLIDQGAYNFDGSLQQYKKIWKRMSYNFTKCRELKTFGQQPEGFFAFTNAIFHTVNEVDKIEYVDDLGVTVHENESYYAPAFSKIYASERKDNDLFEQDRYFIYKDIPEADRLTFEQWAALMDEVYKVNDNGKWAVLFSILCAFREFIYSNKKFFTTLFFIGPTGSGKSQVAFSIRSLFMSPDAPAFNLNSGTNAAFFMVLERRRNVPEIMEEYNDRDIDPVKFQGLKSAILDGEGKIKVKDMGNKTMDSSKINAIPMPLGQEAPQQDDGSLSNRSILCDVPYKPKGDFTDHEIEIFDKLKKHERIGLCNVLLDVLKLRPIFIKHYLAIFDQEVKKLKAAITMQVSNTEGLSRIINSVSLVVSVCRLLEENTSLKLPFTYETFFEIAARKVLKQVEMISTSNKLTTYFNTIGFLIGQGQIKINRELKVVQPGKVTILCSGKKTETKDLSPLDTKVLFLDFSGIYPLYQRFVGKEALSSQSLKSYFESNQTYIGLCKATKFRWLKEVTVPYGAITETGASASVAKRMQTEENNTSAYMFNYDMLKELMNIDFERGENILSGMPEDIPEETAEAEQEYRQEQLPFTPPGHSVSELPY